MDARVTGETAPLLRALRKLPGERGSFLFGADYNPEQWDEATWAEDVALMRRAGLNFATVGVFAWAQLEPRPDVFRFDWFDRALDLLHAGGIGLCLATPTASPPPWLGERWPETLPRTEDGTTIWYGSRNQFCASSPAYRERAAIITDQIAARYADHPGLLVWHVGNEYNTPCFCDGTAEAFRGWLRGRYQSLDRLNDAWGTTVWSQRFDRWQEVIPPRRAQWLINPGLMLDFKRFTSHALMECFLTERDLIRKRCSDVPVTTNFMEFFDGVDAWAWAREQDVVSIDVHPHPLDPFAGAYCAMLHDLTRSEAQGAPWLLMEQSPGAVVFQGVNHPKPPGMLRAQTFQAVARGARGAAFFQWRQSRVGPERFQSAVVPHAGPESPMFRRVGLLGRQVAELGGLLAERPASRTTARVAVLHDWPNWWSFAKKGAPSNRMDYAQLLRHWYQALWTGHLTVDFQPSDSDRLDQYEMVVAPNLYLVDEAAVRNLVAYVRGGGTLVVGFFSGIVDEYDRVRPGGMDSRLRDLLAMSPVLEWRPLEPGESISCDSETLGSFTGSLWSEEFETRGTVVASFCEGPARGSPAVTRAHAGEGEAWYVATLPERTALTALLTMIARGAGVQPTLAGLPARVEAVEHGGLLFLINHGDQAERIAVPSDYVTVFRAPAREPRTDGPIDSPLLLEPFDVAVLEHKTGLGTNTRQPCGAESF